MGYDSNHPIRSAKSAKLARNLAPGHWRRSSTAFPHRRVDDDRTGVIIWAFTTSRQPKQACRPTSCARPIQNDILKCFCAARVVPPDRAALRLILGLGYAPLTICLRLPPRAGSAAAQAGGPLAATADAASSAASTSTTSRRGCRSSGTSTTEQRGIAEAARRARWARPMKALRRSRVRGSCVPLADGRRHADRAAADEQRRARRVSGAGGRAGWNTIAAHELDG